MRYYIIAGEPSGDLYGALLIKALLRVDTGAEIRFWGGDKMREACPNQAKSIRDTAFMGFIEVARNLPVIFKLFSFAKKDIKLFNPDIVICIDYPGFNLRLVKWAKTNNFHTAYYISPKLWAWREGRHKTLKSYVDLFFVIFPFEEAFYKNLDVDCQYVGHPLLEVIKPLDMKNPPSGRHPVIALLPGSRQQELRHHLPFMVNCANANPELDFVMAAVDSLDKDLYFKHFKSYAPNLEIVFGDAYSVLSSADAAIVASGTATLETALHGVPQIVVYKTGRINYLIAKSVIKTRFISLVNLICGKEVVPEIIQYEMTLERLNTEIQNLLSGPYRQRQADGYALMRKLLSKGDASDEVSVSIFNFLATN